MAKTMSCSVRLRCCLVVFSSFIVRVLVGGFWSSLGLFFIEWQEYFGSSISQISWIGSIFTTILWMSCPIASALSHRISFRLNTMIGGLIVSSMLLTTSLFANKLPHICATFGIIGIGLGLAVFSVQSALVFNFDNHLGIAAGLANTGAGAGVFIMPPLLEFLLDQFGWRGSLMIASGLYANICVCGAVFRPTLSERQMHKETLRTPIRPASRIQNMTSENLPLCISRSVQFFLEIKRSFDISLFYTNVRFIGLFIAGFLTGFCYSPVLIYLPLKVVEEGLSRFEASLLMSVVGIFSVIARFASGVVVNYNLVAPSRLCGMAYATTGGMTFFFPGGNSFALFAIIAVVFGLSSGVYNCLHLLVAKEFAGVERTSGAYAWFQLNCGLGSLPGVYLSGYLYDRTGDYRATFWVAGAFSLICAVVFLSGPTLQRIQDLLDLYWLKRRHHRPDYKENNTENDK